MTRSASSSASSRWRERSGDDNISYQVRNLAAMKETLRVGIFDWIEAPANRTTAELYAHKLELAQAGDRAGLHAYLIAEHQGTPLSINAEPSVMLSAMSQ